MDQPRENLFKKRVKIDLDYLPNCYYFVKEALSLRGIADIIGCVNGRFFALELKKNSAEAYKQKGRIVLQKYYLEKVRKAGGYGVIAYPMIWPEIYEELGRL